MPMQLVARARVEKVARAGIVAKVPSKAAEDVARAEAAAVRKADVVVAAEITAAIKDVTKVRVVARVA